MGERQRLFAYNWLLDGHPGDRGPSRLAGPGRPGHRVACRVTACGPGGTSTAVNSRPLRLR
ncbi:MAG TPA: hypothetical protein VGI73_05100 [Solirubrobacterales bacterium]